MPFTQDNRFIAIATPLEKDTLLLKSVSITEQLGRPFVIKADLVSEEPAVDFLEIIGKAVTIRVRMPEESDSAKKRYFSGYVSSFLQRPRAEGFYCYEATIVPWLWFLTRTADCRIFHKAMSDPPNEMSVPGIIKKVFKDHGFDDVTDALTGTYREMDHCVQYRETDYNFVSRLMEQEGIYYYFEHKEDGGVVKHKLKLADSKSAHAEYPSFGTLQYRASAAAEAGTAESKGSILSWSRIKSVQAGTFKLNDFDFKRPKTSLLGSNTKENQHANAGFEIYDNAANYVDEVAGEHGDAYSKVRMEELNAQHDIIVGHSDCPGIACGSKFTLEGHPRDDENGDYIIVGVTYHCTAEAYKSGGSQSAGKVFVCDFTAVPADVPFRPARVTPKPRIQGPQTAIVVGKAGEEILTDEFGRIKVQFHWDRYSPANENSPCWVRVAQSWAGKNWGAVFLPRIGQEVIVEFLDGNPDRPIVTGAVYNGESKPPYPLPDNATMSTIKSNSSKGGQGFNEIRFEDKKGSEQVFMHAEKDQDIRVKEVAKEWIGKDQHLIVKGKKYELVEGDQHNHVKGDELTKVDGNIGRTVGKNEIGKVTGNEHLAVDGNYVLKVGGNLHEAVTGSHHEKTTGDIRLTTDGNADIKSSMNAALVGGMNVHVKGGMVVVIEAGMQLSLKAGASFIDIGPAGISLSGAPLVNINTGGAAGSGSGAQAASPSSPDAPDAPTDALEAATADPGSSVTKEAPSPPTPKTFSASAKAMQEAAASASPLVAEPAPSPAETAASASSTAAAAAGNASTAAAAAAAAAGAASSAAAASTNPAAAAAANTAASAATAASGAAATAAEEAAKAAEAAKEAAEAAKQEAKQAAEEATEEAQEKAEEAQKGAEEAAQEAKEKAKEAAEEGTEEAKAAADEAQEAADKAKEKADEAKEAAKDAKDKADEAAEAATEKADAAAATANQASAAATAASANASAAAAKAASAVPPSPSLPGAG